MVIIPHLGEDKLLSISTELLEMMIKFDEKRHVNSARKVEVQG